MKNRGTWVLRAILLAIVVLALVGLFRNSWLTRAKSLVADTEEQSDEQSETGADGEYNVRPGEEGESGDDNVDDSPDLKHPLTKALGQALQGQQDRLGEDGEDIQQSLLEADEILWRERLAGREAIREANRQLQLQGRVPNVLLIVCEGLRTSDVGCYQGTGRSHTPNIDQLAAQGMRLTALRSDGVAKDEWSLVTGRNWTSSEPPKLESREFTFSRVLWQAGYTTAVIGDCWWWGVALDDFDLDAWFGFRVSQEAANAFPEHVWSNGRQIRLKANADGKTVLGAQNLFVKEANAYLTRNRRGRPFMLCVSLSLNAPADGNAASIEMLDENVGQIVNHLDQQGLGRNTMLMVIGTSPEESTERNAPAIVRWPGRIPARAVFQETVDFADILPTVTDAVQALRRPRNLTGASRFGEWQAVEVSSDKPEL